MKKLLVALLALAGLSSEISAFRFFGANRVNAACPAQCPPQCPAQCPQQACCPPQTVKACPPRVKCCRQPVRCCPRPRKVCCPAIPKACPAPRVACPAPCPQPECCQYPYYQGRHCCQPACAVACPAPVSAPYQVGCPEQGSQYINGYQGGALSTDTEGLPVEGAIQGQVQYDDQNQYQERLYVDASAQNNQDNFDEEDFIEEDLEYVSNK